MTNDVWNPRQYLRFGDERTRPVAELLTRIGSVSPREVVDLGCGPGNSTAVAASRWPNAQIQGIDSSPEMIEKARAGHPDMQFAVQDLQSWLAAGELHVDVVFSNATLQWIPDHLALLPDLVSAVRPGGWLAIGVPGNFAEPSHRLRRALASQPPFAEYTAEIAEPTAHDPEVYLRALLDLGCAVDAWETTYLHQLSGDDAVFDWISGTSLRPTLAALPKELRTRFADELKDRLRQAYPPTNGVVVLPFRRVFVVAQVS